MKIKMQTRRDEDAHSHQHQPDNKSIRRIRCTFFSSSMIYCHHLLLCDAFVAGFEWWNSSSLSSAHKLRNKWNFGYEFWCAKQKSLDLTAICCRRLFCSIDIFCFVRSKIPSAIRQMFLQELQTDATHLNNEKNAIESSASTNSIDFFRCINCFFQQKKKKRNATKIRSNNLHRCRCLSASSSFATKDIWSRRSASHSDIFQMANQRNKNWKKRWWRKRI